MQQEMSYFTKEENTRGNQDNVVQLFLCNFCDDLFVCTFSGCAAILQMQANLTPAWTAAQCMRNEKKYHVCG